MKCKINWPHQFELFMAQQPDYKGVPVWDRWLWWCNKGASFGTFCRHNEYDIDTFLLDEQVRYYIHKAFTWCCSEEPIGFWNYLSNKWLARIETINRREARSEG